MWFLMLLMFVFRVLMFFGGIVLFIYSLNFLLKSVKASDLMRGIVGCGAGVIIFFSAFTPLQ